MLGCQECGWPDEWIGIFPIDTKFVPELLESPWLSLDESRRKAVSRNSGEILISVKD